MKIMSNSQNHADRFSRWSNRSMKNSSTPGSKSHENSWLVALLSFVMGLILCQTVCGRQLDKSPSPRPRLNDFSPDKTERPAKTSRREKAQAPLTLSDLGGQNGYGSGATIGSGIAEIVIDDDQSSTQSNPQIARPAQQAQPLQPLQPLKTTGSSRRSSSLKTIDADLIPQKAPGKSASFRAPQENLVDDSQSSSPSFGTRRRGMLAPSDVVPQPLAYGEIYDPERQVNPWNPNSRKDEVVLNGGDQGKRASVDSSWNLYDVNPEDTIGHFDTLDGRRLVTPSNQVAIYAPRFAAVRKLSGLVNSEARIKVGSIDEKKVLSTSESRDFSTTTKQYEGLDRIRGSKRASAFRDTNRGVTAGNTIQLMGARNIFEPFENLSLFRLGMHQKSEEARLGLGIQSANVWQDNLGMQVTVKGTQPVIVNDVYKIQQIVRIDSDDKQAILRVCKVASKISARPGEHVDFSIRFDNLTGRPVGNVTIVDNLTGRLEYVADSAECSLKSNFSFETNPEGSLVLRWEIIDPLAANTGGIIRFRCRVR